MSDLSSDDPRAARTQRVVADLTELAGALRPTGRHLLLHRSVDARLLPLDTPLPAGITDARTDDGVLLTLRDPTAVLVVADGPHQFTPPPSATEPGWEELVAASRTPVTLVWSRLTGRYWGLHGDGSPWGAPR